jgi:NADH-quinone oxidoreductase subunit G
MSDVTTTTTETVQVTIDGQPVTVPKNTLLIEACKQIGTEIPSFCYWPGLSLQAACRMCLVKVEKIPKLATACTTVVMDGMVVHTDIPEIHDARKSMLEFLLTNHPLDCPVCDKGGECELQDMVFRYGAAESRFIEEKEHQPEQQFSPVVYFDYGRCILCFRCVRVCDEGMDVKALGVGNRGIRSVILPNQPDGTLECEQCGMCVDICPVGALTSQQYRYKTRPWEMQYVATPCAHCADGCKTTLNLRNNQIVRGNNRDKSGINGEFLCIKGRYAGDFTHHPERLRYPMVRRDGRLQPASWEDALGRVANGLRLAGQEHGPNSVGFLGSNRTTNEENYLLNRFARSVIGTNNIDHHRTADFAALIGALGGETGRYATMQDVEQASAILLIGNDPTHNHPLLAWNIRSAVRQHHANLYILNSREIKLRLQARHFVLLPSGAEPDALETLRGHQQNLPDSTAEELEKLWESLENEKDVIVIFGAELSGESIRKLVSLGNTLPGMTRYIALADYANSRGAADMGLLPGRLPGYVPTSDAAGRKQWESLWGTPVPTAPGLTAPEMLHSEKLRALYVVGSNPFKTYGLEPSRESLPALEFLVVHELFMTETAQLADVVLPAASLYEKEGTVTNTCGEVQRLRPALDPGEVRTDFDILRLLTHAMNKPMHYRSPEAVAEEIHRHVPGYGLSMATLLAGQAVPTAPLDGQAPVETATGLVFSSDDSLFTSGTLGRYSQALNLVKEKDLPRSKL